MNSYEQALQSFILKGWWICKRDGWEGLAVKRPETLAALIDLRDNGIVSVSDPTPNWGSKFAGTDCDADTFRYEKAVITSGSGASYTFADESYGEIGIGQMIRAVLDHADKPVKQVLNDRISRLQNPQNRGRL